MTTRTITFPIIVEGHDRLRDTEKILRDLLGERVGNIQLDQYYDEHKRPRVFYAVSPTMDAPPCSLDIPEIHALLKEKGWLPKDERLPYPQISFEDLYHDDGEIYDGRIEYSFNRDMFETFPGFFDDCESNNEASDKLVNAGVVRMNQTDPESSCAYFYMKDKTEAEDFVEKLNAWLKGKYEAIQTAAAY